MILEPPSLLTLSQAEKSMYLLLLRTEAFPHLCECLCAAFLLPCFSPPESSKPVMHAALRLQKHEEFMSCFVLCSLLNGPFGFLSTAEQWMGIFRKLSTLTIGSLLPVTIVRTASYFLRYHLGYLLLPQHHFADQHWSTSTVCTLYSLLWNHSVIFATDTHSGQTEQHYQQLCHTTIHSFPHHLDLLSSPASHRTLYYFPPVWNMTSHFYLLSSSF